jgi:hypothetical protein
MRLFRILFVTLFVLNLLIAGSCAAEPVENTFCVFYFTGIGCTHCAQVDPIIFSEWLGQYPGLVVIEYEIYQQQENGYIFDQFVERYDTRYGTPLLIVSDDTNFLGTKDTLNNAPPFFNALFTGSKNSSHVLRLNECILSELEGYPKIWHKDRILIRTGCGGENGFLQALLQEENITAVLQEHGVPFDAVNAKPVQLSGDEVAFDHAILIEGWIFQWNGAPLGEMKSPINPEPSNSSGVCMNVTSTLTYPKIISLAVVDAVNPCALAVLMLMLIAILTSDPQSKRKVLLAGLAFSASIYVVYLLYGLVIIRFFQAVQVLTSVRILLYTVLGVLAIILGLLNIKDFLQVGPRGLFTTMPKALRGWVSGLITGVTSVPGAALVGAAVTVFLLPCTIGPYIIAGGVLSVLDLVETIPYLLLYNLIFILPMLSITTLVYFGCARIEDVSGWKDENIRYLHGIAGGIMLLLGAGMVMGVF